MPPTGGLRLDVGCADGLVEELRGAGINPLTSRDFDFPGADPATNEAAASLVARSKAARAEGGTRGTRGTRDQGHYGPGRLGTREGD